MFLDLALHVHIALTAGSMVGIEIDIWLSLGHFHPVGGEI